MILMLLFLNAAAGAQSLVSGLSSNLNDYNFSTDRNGRVAVFARSEADFRNARIFITERKGREWSVPQQIGFSDASHSDSDPWLTPNGRTLYFISDRPAPGREAARKDYDIWRSVRTASGWSAPEHLGPEVNSKGQELGPELHGGTLYFASARRSGLGGLDIYQARVKGSGFDTATLLPGPFNGPGSDSDFTLSRDGKAAMFWRSEGPRGIIHIAYLVNGAWSQPTPLPSDINIGPFNFTPSFSARGERVYFASTLRRAGQTEGLADLYERPLPKR